MRPRWPAWPAPNSLRRAEPRIPDVHHPAGERDLATARMLLAKLARKRCMSSNIRSLRRLTLWPMAGSVSPSRRSGKPLALAASTGGKPLAELTRHLGCILLTFNQKGAGMGLRTKAVSLTLSVLVGGCAIQRAQVAQDAQGKMIGLSKEQVLACMGPPVQKAAEGATEVWSYASGDGTTVSSGFGQYHGYGLASATSTSRSRFCTVNVTMTAGRVSQINYLGPTGGLLTRGEQCAFAVERCAQ